MSSNYRFLVKLPVNYIYFCQRMGVSDERVLVSIQAKFKNMQVHTEIMYIYCFVDLGLTVIVLVHYY